jgi:hypothetical protein
MCNCLTLNVDSVNSELTISGTLNGKNTYSDGTYTVSWNGSRWEVYEEVVGCDVISVTYALVGEEAVTVDVELNEDGNYYLVINGLNCYIDRNLAETQWSLRRVTLDTFYAVNNTTAECPFGNYTLTTSGDDFLEAFSVQHAQNLIGTNTNNTVCPLGIFTPITVTNVNITECFNENDIQPLIQLTEQLYPTGRGFNIHIGSFIRKMHLALNRSESRLNDNTLDILNGILPDNDSFTVEDATLWEQRLGLITNDAVSLANRKLAIIRKLNYPGTIIARQSGGFIESQLRLAGFDVYVHENPDLITIENLLYSVSNVAVAGVSNAGSFNAGSVLTEFSALFDYLNAGSFNAGSSNAGSVFFKGKVANHIDENLDATFTHQNNWIKTFFIGGENLGDFADVPTARKDEFRQLILKLKPTETVAYLLIDYV